MREASPQWGVPKASDSSLLARKEAQALPQRDCATIERTLRPNKLVREWPFSAEKVESRRSCFFYAMQIIVCRFFYFIKYHFPCIPCAMDFPSYTGICASMKNIKKSLDLSLNCNDTLHLQERKNTRYSVRRYGECSDGGAEKGSGAWRKSSASARSWRKRA